MRFFKGHALGNDYIVLLDVAPGGLTARAVRALCERQVGLGADGVVVVGAELAGAARDVEVWNADGSRAEVSGNGLRIAALALGLPEGLRFASAAREYGVSRRAPSGWVALELPPARVERPSERVAAAGRAVAVVEVDVGNPHAVVQAGEISVQDWPELAAELAVHPRWPAGRNVERLEPVGPEVIRIAIHERGVGPTTASGTGALAAAVAAHSLGLVRADRAIRVLMEGGEVEVEILDAALVLSGRVDAIGYGEIAPAFAARLGAL